MKIGTYTTTINVKDSTTTATDSFILTTNVEPDLCTDGPVGKLEIKDVDLESEYEVGDTIEVTATVENNFQTEDVDDVYLEAFLYDITKDKKLIFKISIITALFLLAFSGVIAKFLHIENILAVVFLAPILFLSLITLVNQAASQGIIKFIGNVVPILISSLLKFILGIFFVYIGWSVQGAMLAIVIGIFLAYVYSAGFIKKYIKKAKISKVDLTPFIKYSGPVLLQSLAFTSIFTIDVILVKHFLDPFSAGIYAAISTLGKIIFFATSPVTATMFPVISRRRALNQGYIKIFLGSLLITLAVAAAITAFYWLFPNLAIGILYGKDYLSAKTDLVWMGIFILFYTLSNLLVNFFLSMGKLVAVIFPLVAAIVQAILIWFNHENITEVIQISLFVTLAMFICLSLYTGYNLIYESKDK